MCLSVVEEEHNAEYVVKLLVNILSLKSSSGDPEWITQQLKILYKGEHLSQSLLDTGNMEQLWNLQE